jgi:hypothetical protein
MVHKLCRLLPVALVVFLALTAPAGAQKESPQGDQPDRIRGQVATRAGSRIVVKTIDGQTVPIELADYTSVFRLAKASFTDVEFGVYVGSVSKRLDEESPIVRDSMSWLHQGYELRILDEALRGLALGHTKWDLTPESVMTHGWVDDLEVRVLSIKYGPTEEEETDVDIGRDVPILKLSPADESLIKPGVHVFVGAQKGEYGGHVAVFVMVGENDIIPPL